MALDLLVKVFPPVPSAELEAQLNQWLAAERGIQVVFVAQSSHLVGEALYLTVSLFYTEPSDRERALQAQMQTDADAGTAPAS